MASNKDMAREIEVAALGRPFTLGMLYDAHKDELCKGFTLWDKKTLEENSTIHKQYSSAFEITASDTIESKCSLLNVDTSLKASFISGLIEVEGSAKFLNDHTNLMNQSRVTLNYKATTNFQKFAMTDEEAKSKRNAVFTDKNSATHVVTSILYGANAFFVFDNKNLDSSNVHCSIEALIKKIPSFKTKESICLKLAEEEKALTDILSCKFYGDFILEKNPATFEDAVQAYIELPKLLGQNHENSVPLKVWLTPLKKFDLKADALKRDICPELVKKAGKALEDVVQAEIRCKDSLKDKVVQKVPTILEKLNIFQKHCEDYKVELKQQLSEIFISIRKKEVQETLLERFLENTKRSPYSNDKLNNWMNEKEREITAICSLVGILKDTKAKMVANESELKEAILHPSVHHGLCFVFTFTVSDDSYLGQMHQYYQHLKAQREPSGSFDKNATQNQDEKWYNSKTTLNEYTQKAEAFRDLARNIKNNTFSFFIVVIPTKDKQNQNVTIYHYRDDKLVTKNFSKPQIPDVKSITNREDLIWYATDLTMDPKTANKYLTLSDGNKKATMGEEQNYPDLPERFDYRTQVLCTEGLTGIHYWEVEWSPSYYNNVGVGVTYKQIERKGNSYGTGLGSNVMSWLFWEKKGYLYAYHDGNVWNSPLPPSGFSKLGVFLDYPAGTLSLYNVMSNAVEHIYTFSTKFSKPVYPGFWIYTNYACLCEV